jgi:polyhydroxyalkanoate synthesis regulator phasin
MPRDSADNPENRHSELVRVLDAMLACDADITAREVARRHPAMASASTITRHPERRQLLTNYQQRQDELRQWKGRLSKTSKGETAARLASQQARIDALETTVQTLTQGHLALIAAVAQVGGMGKLAKYYEQFSEVRNRLLDAGALPADVPPPIASKSTSRPL